MGTEQSVHRSRAVPVYDDSMSIRFRNNYHPLHFHNVHGDNIKLSKNRTVACRSEGFCNGIVFSDRPVTISEPVYVKFLETSPNWSGALRIGFTMNDPFSLKSKKLPRYACPDLTAMPGNWAKAVGEKHAKKDSILYYYVDHNGDVHYGIGAEEYGIFFGGVNTSGKLWAVLDIYGNTVAVELMDPNALNQEYQSDSHSNSAISQNKHRSKLQQNIQPLCFHTVHGKNVTLKSNRSIVSKKSGIKTLAYAFTERPVEIGKTIIMIVQQTDHYCEGLFVYGITSCNPKKVIPHELPENVYDLLDRSEYWIVKQKPYPFDVGDILTFRISNQGQVEMTTNEDTDPVFYVDHTQPLWLFVNLTHSISELSLKGIFSSTSAADISEAFGSLQITNSDNTGVENPGPSGEQSSNECVICYEELVDCALYRCGHMCMCYNCASKLWDSGSGAQCPICRNSIQDVIKIYK